MKITVTAELTPEQIEILSKMKGYQSMLTVIDTESPTNLIESENPQSKEDYIRQVYEGIIKADASHEFIAFAHMNREAEKLALETSIREQVDSSVTSNIE